MVRGCWTFGLVLVAWGPLLSKMCSHCSSAVDLENGLVVLLLQLACWTSMCWIKDSPDAFPLSMPGGGIYRSSLGSGPETIYPTEVTQLYLPIPGPVLKRTGCFGFLFLRIPVLESPELSVGNQLPCWGDHVERSPEATWSGREAEPLTSQLSFQLTGLPSHLSYMR